MSKKHHSLRTASGATLCLVLSFFFCYTNAQNLKLVLPIGHTDVISSAQFSPDGKQVVTASADRTAKLWDVATGFLLADFKGHKAGVDVLLFSPDGTKVITGSTNFDQASGLAYDCFLWDSRTGKPITSAPVLALPLKSPPLFNHTGDKILAVSDSARLWSIEKGTISAVFATATDDFYPLAFSADSKLMVSTDAGPYMDAKSPKLKIWNTATGKLAKELTGHTALIKLIRFTADGKKMMTVSMNETLIWDVALWKLVKRTPVVLNGNDALLATPDFKKLITGSFTAADLFARVWDAASRKQLYKLPGKVLADNAADDLFLSEGGLSGTVVAASNEVIAAVLNAVFYNNFQLGAVNDKTAKLWNINTGKEIATLTGHTLPVNYIQFSPDGKKILTASDDRTAKIWDATTSVLLTDLKGHTFSSRSAIFYQPEQTDRAGMKLLTACDDGAVKLWNPGTASLQQSFKCFDGDIFSVAFNHDKTKVIAASRFGMTSIIDVKSGTVTPVLSKPTFALDPTVDDPTINSITGLLPPELSKDGTRLLHAIHTAKASVLDAKTGKLLFTVNNEGTRRLHFAHFSDKGDKIITGWIPEFTGKKNALVTDVWDAHTGRHLFKVKTGSDDLIDAFFADDDKKIVALSNSGPLATISNAADGTLLQEWKADAPWSEGIAISSDKQQILLSSHLGAVRLFNAFSGELLLALDSINNLASAVKPGPDNTLLSMIKKNRTAEIWSVKERKRMSVLQGHTDEILFATIEPCNKRAITGSMDNMIKVWDIASGECLYSFFAVDSSDYFNLLPSGYYSATGTATKLLHYVTDDLKAVSFEQLDVKYNRPDKILSATGNADTALISAYAKAYYKRISKLGIDTAVFGDHYIIPTADILNRDNILTEQKTDKLSLQIRAGDSLSLLRRFNLWINEVPLFGSNGVNLSRSPIQFFDTTITVALSPGENKVEISVINNSGAESYRKPLLVKYVPVTPQEPATYFIGIGINKFADSSHNLKWCVKDIRSLAKSLKQRYGSRFVLLDTVFDEKFTLAALGLLKQKLLATGVNDKVIISYSGHGLLSKEKDYYLSAYHTDFKNPASGSIPYEELEKLLDNIPARKKILLLDACNSGEVDKETAGIVKNSVKSNQAGAGTKGGEVTIDDSNENSTGMMSSFELMQSLFVNVSKGTGAVVIAASGGEQSALEDNRLGNGMFTYSILEAIEQFKKIKISTLKNYIGHRVLELSAGRQKPTTRNEPVSFDWDVW